MEDLSKGYVSVNDKCIGCGRCMLECPAPETNISVYRNGKRTLGVNRLNCINCGGCVSVCSRGAREFEDDTDTFLAALKAGEDVSLIVSTELYMTYGERARNIIGYLRSLGVKKIYDAGYGADIFVYLSARYVKEYSGDPMKRPFILNACPSVLGYICRYEPDAVNYIVPIQSPPICTAIYARKYLGDNAKFAYLGSCISRKAEFKSDPSGTIIDMNVTLAHLANRIRHENLDAFDGETDLTAPGFGAAISASGGLREYLSSLFSDEEIIVEYDQLDDRTRSLISSLRGKDVPHPFLAVIAGCEYGCANSAGADRDMASNHKTYIGSLHKLRRESIHKKHAHSAYWELYQSLSGMFTHISPDDFETVFRDNYVQLHTVPENIMNEIFSRLHMTDEAKRHTDCRACGYHTCRDMASAVAKGYARIEDCPRYVTEEFSKKLFFDGLTGLLTSHGFHAEAAALLGANRDKKYVICAGNINGIKTINDLYNFNVGSQVIVYVARMLTNISRGIGICARLGGDNFVMCIENTDENIRRLMAIRYFDCGDMGINMPVTVRFGLCEVTMMSDLPRIINCASFAMEKNTDTLRNSFRWYDEKMRSEIMNEAAITSQMRSAMYNNEFVMYLQPQYNHSTGELVGAESLCRWVKPDGSIISPGVFIPIFEKNGFIRRLDRFMWENAFKQIRSWMDEGTAAVPISVNISRMSLVDDEIIDVLTKLQKTYSVDRSLLHFEITESAYNGDQTSLIRRITEIRNMGFSIAMDDFGSGYSSLNTLKDIPIDILKLDMGFLRGDSNAEKGGSIIGSVIHMAHSLGLITVAEGVETIEQADFLKSLGCDIIQGYLYARPMPVEKYETLLRNGHNGTLHIEPHTGNRELLRLLDRNSSETRMFESYIGPAAVFEYTTGELNAVRVNDMLIDILGYTGKSPMEFARTFNNRILDKDRINVAEAIKRAEAGGNGTICTFGYMRPDGRRALIRSKIWYLGHNGGRAVIYAIADDVSDIFAYGKS